MKRHATGWWFPGFLVFVLGCGNGGGGVDDAGVDAGRDAGDGGGGDDTEPPVWPGGSTIAAEDVGATFLTLSWDPAQDNVGVAKYRVFRDERMEAAVDGSVTRFAVTGLSVGTGYAFRVEAGDAAGNWSRAGLNLTAETSAQLPQDPADSAPDLTQGSASSVFDAASFLFAGPEAVQVGVEPGAIQVHRAAVLRGQVLDEDGQALPGATVSILGRPDLGRTTSRDDGAYDIVANGGGQVTVRYQMDGRVPAQRTVRIPWQSYLRVSDVALVPRDNQVTTLTPGAAGVQVARGAAVTDADGDRRATLLVPAGTGAEIVNPDGTREALGSLSVRVTEFTVGEDGPRRMPAEMPGNIAYTYAMDLSLDEAEAAGAGEVAFDQPVYYYLENFLGFPAGIAVPAGYYDEERGVWVASESGKVIKILDTAGGTASVDADGDDAPDDVAALAALGFTDEELAQLATLYAAGDTLWRVPITHFSTWDCNWGFSPPGDAEIPWFKPPVKNMPDPCKSGGSVIDCHNLNLGEDIPVAGLPFGLHYRSDRARGAGRRLDIRLRGADAPGSLKGILVEVDVAGQHHEYAFDADPFADTDEDVFPFLWDGSDGWGRETNGSQPVGVSLAWVYDGVYEENPRFGTGGNGAEITGSSTRGEVALWARWFGTLGGLDTDSLGAAGWSLGVHHSYDPLGKELHFGHGGKKSAADLGAIVMVVAGNGEVDPDFMNGNLEGKPATEVALGITYKFAMGPDGSLYLADAYRGVYRVRPENGVLHRVVGGGDGEEEGIPATEFSLVPTIVAVGSDDTLYVGDGSTLYEVRSSGLIYRIAGGGDEDYTGLGPVPARDVDISFTDVELAPDGSLYLLDASNCVIWRCTTDGMLSRVAGVYDACDVSSGDGGPAIEATFNELMGFALGPDGSLYLSDTSSYTVRRVAPNGIIATVAGNGDILPNGDGGPALEAGISLVMDIEAGPDGSLYLAGLHSVRRVGPDGIITTLAGGRDNDVVEDRIPALRAAFHQIGVLELGPDNNLYLMDQAYWGIRMIGTAYTGFAASDEIVIPAGDGDRLFVFDRNGRHLRTVHTWSKATEWEFDYDDDGRLTTIRDADGDETVIERAADGDAVAIHPPEAPATSLVVNADGHLESITDPAGGAHRFTYDPDGLMRTMTDPNDGLFQFDYDAYGKLQRNEDPAGGYVELDRVDDYTADAYVVTLTTALGRTARYFVQRLAEGSDWVLNTYPNGLTVEAVYSRDESFFLDHHDGTRISVQKGPDPRFGMLAPVTEHLNVATPGGLVQELAIEREATLGTLTERFHLNDLTWTLTFDELNREALFQAPSGRQRRLVLNEQGRLAEMQVGDLAPLSMTYNAFGRIRQVTTGEGSDQRVHTFTYDANGFLASVENPVHQATLLERDPAGRLVRQTLPDGREIRLGWDANGNVSSVTPPGRPAHVMGYTGVDLLGSYDPPAAGIPDDVTTFTYNLDQQITSILRPGGGAITFGYDPGARLSIVGHSFGQITVDYHPELGWVSAITTSDGVGLAYDHDGSLLLQETWSGPFSAAVERTYRDDFLLDRLRVAGTSIYYRFDDDRLLIEAGQLDIVPDGNGQVAGTSLDSVTTATGYNQFGESTSFLAEHGAATLLGFTYVRDKNGRIAEKTEEIEGATTHYEYLYDEAGRLVEVLQDGVSAATYEYDANSNRVLRDGDLGTENGSYDDQDRMLTYAGADYAYTDAGDLQSRTVGAQATTYAYDELGNLRSVTLPDATAIEYIVDGRNRRVGKRVDGALVQGFVYIGDLNPVAELDGNGDVVSVFVYGTRPNVPDYMIRGGDRYRILSDHLGSPRLVVDATTGVVVQRIDYDAFGRVLQDTNPGFQPFGFAGGLYDLDTGLIRMGARDYDPVAGRFTSKDPILFAGGSPNLYGYVLMDPVNGLDPDGMKKKLSFGEKLSNFAAGFGDTITLGITKLIRKWRGIDGGVDPCSPQYQHGQLAGNIHQLGSGTAVAMKFAGKFGKLSPSAFFGEGTWGWASASDAFQGANAIRNGWKAGAATGNIAFNR